MLQFRDKFSNHSQTADKQTLVTIFGWFSRIVNKIKKFAAYVTFTVPRSNFIIIWAALQENLSAGFYNQINHKPGFTATEAGK